MAAIDHLEDMRGEAAVEWMIEMGAGTMSERQVRAFEAWLQADPGNQAAWIRLQEGLMPYGVAARSKLSSDMMAARDASGLPSRRSLLTAFAVLGAGTMGAGVLDRFIPLSGMMADHVTFTAQQERIRLADGSEIVLAPRTAANIRYRPGLWTVKLLSGECLVRAAARATPFEMLAGPLTLRTNAGVFAVEDRGAPSLTSIQGAGKLAIDTLEQELPLTPGDCVKVEGGHVRRSKVETEAATAWLDGLLVAKDRPLIALIDRLRPYFPGVIQIDPAIASLRVTGVFLLREPGAALDALAESLDLTLTRVAHYWVVLAPRTA